MNDSANPPTPSDDSALVPFSADAGPDGFPIVGVGASAGGLEALSALLKKLPPHPPFAMVVVQHLDPKHESLLVDLLAQVTPAPVTWATTGETVKPGHIYVAPPNSSVHLKRGRLVLAARADHRSGDIDPFLSTLARDARHRAVGVILSGNGSDGAEGVKAIKAVGGFTFAENKSSAAFPNMPDAAIETGCVDYVLSPPEIADELLKLADEVRFLWPRFVPAARLGPGAHGTDHIGLIFRLLATRTGVDFTDYKESTIRRRLARCMMLAKTDELADYAKLLQKDRRAIDLLFETLLINVTEFFRDPEYFEFLQEKILPALIAHHRDQSSLRLWVPGCATGEEAYSLAIAVRELLDRTDENIPVQIFATDVSEEAIGRARAGAYTAADVASVSEPRLQQFFAKTDRGFAIAKSIRDMCIFSRQNVIRDSPFSRLDLISCRNLLIYLTGKLHRKLIPIFHYALQTEGCLVLGSSESVGAYAGLFQLVDRRFRIYTRKPTAHRPSFELSVGPRLESSVAPPKPSTTMPEKEPFDIIREADRIVLKRHAPAGVLVNEDLEIVQFRGDVSAYLTPTEGRASLNLLKMAREGLAVELEAAVRQAQKKSIRIHKGGISVLHGDTAGAIAVDVTPIDAVQGKERFFLILFSPADGQPAGRVPEPRTRASKSVYVGQIEQLRQDLHATRNYLQSTIEKQEATNQELRAANEEIQSSNEELQSTNEELETAKEELQSTNEELTTLNEELHSRQLELIQLNNDLTNLINSVHLPIVILGEDMRIRRFTPMAEKLMNVIPTDIGRPLTDINTNLDVKELPKLMREVVDTRTIREIEVQDNRGRWYSMRLRPYKTAENKIEGVVLTLIDIHEMKSTIAELEEARDLARGVVGIAHEPLVVLNSQLRIKTANEAFCRLFRIAPENVEGSGFFELVKATDAKGDLPRLLEGVLPRGQNLAEREVRIDLPGAGSTRCRLDAQRIMSGNRAYPLILVALRTS